MARLIHLGTSMIAEPLMKNAGVQVASPDDLLLPTGAQILIEALSYEGVDTIFGYPGGAVLHIYDELWRARERITHYLVRHEQGAVHMAEGYARSTGRVGVVLVTSGPGATNAVTGIANAYMDSTPIVVITGQVPKHLIGTDAFQEVDTVGITRPCVKHNYLVRNVQDLASPSVRKYQPVFHVLAPRVHMRMHSQQGNFVANRK